LINYLDSECNSSILLESEHKQNACDTIYFDYESLTKKQKRNLPHYEQDNVAYFVTFRLWDSIPKDVAEKIKVERKSWKKLHKIENKDDLQKLDGELKKEYYRLFSKRMDDLLDNGHGSCVLKKQEISKIVENAINHFADERYLLDYWVIMPNHVHMIVKPLNNWTLEKITHSWKSFTANEINKALKKEGQLWMHESFDHIVRSPEQLFRIRQYIKDNPTNLPSSYYRMKCNSSILLESGHKQDACDTIPKEDIETLIREGDIILELETAIVEQGKKYDSVLMPSIKENAQALDDALANIKVCDPAIGSGAFPVGMLTEIVKARKVLELYLGNKHGIYGLKRHCIQNSLYGVDIDPGAIEIAKLRLWLSLVVDEDDYTTIQPLPNLDYKIMQGNSLIEEFHGISLDIEKKETQTDIFGDISKLDNLIKDLHQKQDDFFNAEHPREKKQKRDAVETAIYNIFHNELEKKKSISALEAQEIETDLKEMTHGNKERNFFPWKLYFADVFREKGGFDVVIANPPYEQLRDLSDLLQIMYKETKYYKYAKGGRLNLFQFFIPLFSDIARINAIICAITQNSLLCEDTAKNNRKFIFNNTQIIKFDSFPERDDIYKRVFFSVKMSVCISLLKNNISDDYSFSLNIWKERDMENKRVLNVDKNTIVTLFPEKYIVPITDNSSFDLLKRIRLNDNSFFVSANAGEIDMTKYKPYYSMNNSGKRILTGAQVLRYTTTTNPSQGSVIYLDNSFFNSLTFRRNTINKKRIVMQRITGVDSNRRLIMTIIDKGLLCANSTNYIWKNFELSLEYVLGLFNSTFINYYFKMTSTNTNITTNEINSIPIPLNNGQEYQQISSLVDQILTIKKANPQANTTALEAEIDSLVYELYGLTEEEIAIVEESTQ